MSRKLIINIISIISIIIILSSCLPEETYFPPVGIWHSENPNITLYLYPERGERDPWDFEGIFVTDEGEEILIHPRFNGVTGELEIVPIETTYPEIHLGIPLFSGIFETIGDELHHYLINRDIERTGIEVIIFNRLEVSL